MAEALETVEVDPALTGPAQVRAYTVLYEAGEPARVVAWLDAPDGRRTLASCSEPELLALATSEELCGRRVELRADEPQRFRWPSEPTS